MPDNGSSGRMFVPDGADRDHNLAELDGSGNMLGVFVYGPGADEPLVRWDNGANMVHADRLGSIIAVADNGGNVISTNSYDEYGVPAAANQGRFGYTGQAALPEIGVDYYKARMYRPSVPTFMQADPAGYGPGMNRYEPMGSNPVNNTDPSGRTFKLPKSCTGTRILSACGPGGIANGLSGFSTAGVGGQAPSPGPDGGDFGGGSYVCVQSCNNPASGGDAKGNINVYAGPVFQWVSAPVDFQLAQNSITVKLPPLPPPSVTVKVPPPKPGTRPRRSAGHPFDFRDMTWRQKICWFVGFLGSSDYDPDIDNVDVFCATNVGGNNPTSF